MVSPAHPDSHASTDIDPAPQSTETSTDSIHTDIQISAGEPSSSNSVTLNSSSSSPMLLPPVPKLLHDEDNSSQGPLKSPVPDAVAEGLPHSNPSPAASGASASSSAALLSRKLLPVPKFSDNGNRSSSMGPPPAKLSSTSSSRGIMGPPPPVPKFQSSSEEKKPSVAVSSLGVPLATSSKSSSDGPLPSEGEINEAAELSVLGGGDDTSANGAEGNRISDLDGTHLLSSAEEDKKQELHSAGASSSAPPPYVKPSWSAPPGRPFSMEILKSGNILGVEDLSMKGAYMFGRSDRCDFLLEHPTVSRYHAVLQYNSKGEAFIYDLGSTHGTFVNKLQVKGREYVPLHVGDIFRFGHSSRLHVFQGPRDLMPEEGLSKRDRQSQRVIEAAQDRAIREASLIRGKRDSMASDGISWGMQEDAEEEAEGNVEEVTWQTFKGELTERQQKTISKVHKYNEKLSNLRKENDAIQAKEISQGGLTQGQQTQVARNEQRMAQLVEEVENLEETVNESIQESISGRTGIKRRGKKNPFEDEDEDDLSDDEFYDRASKMQRRKSKEVVQKVETSDSLLDQKAILATEIHNLREAIIAEERTSVLPEGEQVVNTEADIVDPLDQFMTQVSSTIMKDKSSHLQKELDSLSKELERVDRLLKIADPTGEGLKKWEVRRTIEGKQEATGLTKQTSWIFPRQEAKELATAAADMKPSSGGIVLQETVVDTGELKSDDSMNQIIPSAEEITVLPGLEPPVRLGAAMPEASEEVMAEVSEKVNEEAVKFITYKERKKGIDGRHQVPDAEAVPKVDGQKVIGKEEDVSTVDVHVADSVALLLRQKRGLAAEDSDASQNTPQINPPVSVEEKQGSKQSSRKKKKHGTRQPHPTDMDISEDWVPPAGQTGDGRTALNDKYGY